ncbi:MAG: Gx transporter family protein [bacterium]|nr:Gx transporter family protein [bacterium]
MRGRSTGRLARLALLVAMGLIVWVVEMAIPIPFAIPGAKLGLVNVIILWCLIRFGLRDALLVNGLRIVLGTLLTGAFLSTSFFLALAGGVSSALIMGLLHRGAGRLSVVGISLAGAFTHNLAQVLMAALLIGHLGVLAYLPYLLLFALPTGFFVGLVVMALVRAGAATLPETPLGVGGRPGGR